MLTARTGKGQPQIEISGTNRWLRSERYDYLNSREAPLPKITGRNLNTKLETRTETPILSKLPFS